MPKHKDLNLNMNLNDLADLVAELADANRTVTGRILRVIRSDPRFIAILMARTGGNPEGFDEVDARVDELNTAAAKPDEDEGFPGGE